MGRRSACFSTILALALIFCETALALALRGPQVLTLSPGNSASSPCGSCPSGATCRLTPAHNDVSLTVPYCACPNGYGMTPDACVKGAHSTVSGDSITLSRKAGAQDQASFTFRPNMDSCTQLPEAVAGSFDSHAVVLRMGTPSCAVITVYDGDNCTGAQTWIDLLRYPPFFATTSPLGLPHTACSVMCLM
ncbi:hypothetical protein CLOM_g8490 [Closterium sp. NIES-68]|nr:hypothetical protein CLOM_g8490 [Closterium sp. NIES-68]GJP78341.1 hypothetical protein CLOP_g8659 [Closterium sp. NIES-67]